MSAVRSLMRSRRAVVAAGAVVLAVAVGAALWAASGSGTGSGGEPDRDPPGATGEEGVTDDGLVCGLVDVDLVRRVTGDGEIGTRGRGVTGPAERAREPATCTVQDVDRSQTVLEVSIGEVADPGRWQRELAGEAAGEPDCRDYTGEPGVGYGCTYDRGVRVDGAGVHVLRGDRLVRVTVHHWPGVTPQERLALAEDVAVDVDRNVTAYDRSHP